MEGPSVSIIIPAYNSASTIAGTVEACLDQDYPQRLEIIVVDDGSSDRTREIIKAFPVRYIAQRRQGPASARNNGSKNARGEALCFVDADCIPHKDWVSRLVRHYNRAGVGAVAGSYDVGNSRHLLDRLVHYEIRYRHSMMGEYINSFGTYNVLIKRHVFEESGGFDPVYSSASGEDSDLSYRIVRLGYRIYFEKGALVNHCSILKLFKYLRVQFRHSYWRMKLYKKQPIMIAKDEYGCWKDFAELVLAAGFVFSLLLGFEASFMIAGLFIIALLAVELLLPIRISLEQRDTRYMIFCFVTFIRVFIRITGGAAGFVRFWVLKG